MKPKWYFCELWRMNYYFYIGWKHAEFSAYVKKNHNYTTATNDDVGAVGKCFLHTDEDGGTRTHIWVEKKTDYPSLAHECLHATNYTLDRAGWLYHPENHETQTYLMTNLMRQALGRGVNK